MFRHFCVAGVLVLSLCTAGAASALPLDPEMAEAAEEAGLLGGLWDRLLDWIERVAGGDGEDGLTLIRTDTCHLDPNGLPCGGGN